MKYKCSECGALFINDTQERAHYYPDGLCPMSCYKTLPSQRVRPAVKFIMTKPKNHTKEVRNTMALNLVETPQMLSGGMTVETDQSLQEFLEVGWEKYGISVLERVRLNTAVVAVNGEIVHLFGPLGRPISVESGDEVFVLSVIAGG